MILQDDRDVRSSVLAQGFEMTTSDLIAPDGLGHGREQGGTWSRHGSTKNGRETPIDPRLDAGAARSRKPRWERGTRGHGVRVCVSVIDLDGVTVMTKDSWRLRFLGWGGHGRAYGDA